MQLSLARTERGDRGPTGIRSWQGGGPQARRERRVPMTRHIPSHHSEIDKP
jgi:hypothetical protein